MCILNTKVKNDPNDDFFRTSNGNFLTRVIFDREVTKLKDYPHIGCRRTIGNNITQGDFLST